MSSGYQRIPKENQQDIGRKEELAKSSEVNGGRSYGYFFVNKSFPKDIVRVIEDSW